MKKTFASAASLALLLTSLPAWSQTTFFNDTFASSTTNGVSTPGGTPTASSTSYDIAATKNTSAGVAIAANDLRLSLSAATTSGFMEAQALFTANPVALSINGDYIDISVIFTNTTTTTGELLAGTSSLLWIGLYSSGGSTPVAGGLSGAGLTATASSPFATGNCANWQGYVAQISSGGVSRITTRPLQNGAGTTSANQELCGNNVGGGAFNNPAATVIATAPATSVPLTVGGQYTLEFRLTVTGPNILTVSNFIYAGSVATGTPVFAQGSTNISGATYLTGSFDGLAIGYRNSSSTAADPIMDISSIKITGQSSAVTGPPTLTAQPTGVVVATNGTCDFSVSAVGFGVNYQWHRNGTNLLDGGNISGATSSTLIISPATTADIFSGANGYYVTVSGTGGFSTNSVTNSLSLVRGTNLIWTAAGGINWDVASTVSWKDTNGNASAFNFGDAVTFDDTAGNTTVSLNNSFLSPSFITVNTSGEYVFQGNGSISGPCTMLVSGSGVLDLKAGNTYTGGTIVSNSQAYIYLENYNGLGNGPVTFDKAGQTMEIVTNGSASIGVNGDINIADDTLFLVDGSGTFSSVFLGNLSGTAGKTLTINTATTVTNRYRFYGANTLCAANVVLNGAATPQAQYFGTVMAPYNVNGTQIYNGVISGNGGLIQRGTGTTILNAQNTYSGGTTPSTGLIGFGSDSVGSSSGPIGTGYLLLAPEVPNTTGSGQVFAAGGAHTVGNPIVYPSATNNQILVVGGTNNLTLSGPFGLNGLDGLGAPTNRTVQVTNTALTVLSGVISDGGLGFGFIKTGNGILALNNNETYTGPTAVNGGTLLVNNSLAASSVVTVATNGTLGGKGTIPNAVTVQSGGTLAPQNIGVGTLTINNTLTLSAGSTNVVQVSKTANTKDVVTANNVVYAGTLIATNLAGSLTTSDSFTIYNAAAHSGNFSAIAGSPGAGLAWAFNPANGVLSVVNGVNLNPTNITFTVTGSTLSLSWPADHTGWHLQSQTNTASKGLSTNWVEVAGGTSVDTMSFTINPANPAVFYRIVSP